MRKQSISQFDYTQQGVVLIEAMVAILIFSVGVLGIVGMQANMIKNTSESQYRADAGYIAQQRIGLLWADSANLPADPSTTTTAEPLLPNGTVTIIRTGKVFEVTVAWQQPGEVAHSFTTNAGIVGEGPLP